jgi:hypothetical protein
MVMFHSAIAAGMDTPELVLSPQEAESLSSSGLTFLAQFDVKPNPKVTAGIIFASNVAAIYGTRFAAIRIRKAQEAKERQPNTAGVWGANGEAQGTTAYAEGEFGPIDLSNLNNPKYMS